MSAQDSGGKQDVGEILHKGTRAVPIKADAPVYPPKALRAGIEGWAVVSLNVQADGTTSGIEIFKTSIDDYFDEAATEAASKRLYRPATLQGEPVIQANLLVRYVFRFEDSNRGVSREFQEGYKAATLAIRNGDFSAAKGLIKELEETPMRLLAEECYLDMLKAAYYAKKNNSKYALRYLDRALVIADTVTPKKVYLKLLRQSVVENGKAGNYQRALRRYDTLLETDKSLAEDDPIHPFVTRIKDLLASDATIQSAGEIVRSCNSCEDDTGYGRYLLSRGRFLIDQVEGHLEKVEIGCQYSLVTVAHDPETVWTVNRDGGECTIKVFGEMNTTFRLLEFAD